MSHAMKAGLFGGLGAFQVGFGLEGLLEYSHKTQTLVEAYLAKASSLEEGAVNDAYQFAHSSLSNPVMAMPLLSLLAGSLFLGIALYDLAKSYERKE